MAGVVQKIYAKSPVFMQHAMVSAFGLYWKRRRMGKNFKKLVGEYSKREHFSKEEWDAYTLQKLRKILVLAYTSVPFYRTHWKGIVTLDQLKKFTVQDMPSLPPLEKAIARDRPHDLLVNGHPHWMHRVQHTSGSSGIPIATYWLQNERITSIAVRHARYLSFAGVGYYHPRATFSGRMVEPNPESKGPYHRYNLFENQIYFSAFHLRPDTVQQYVNALIRHRSQWVIGYSNSIYQLSQMVLDQKIETPQIRAVITTSEKLTSEMREVIQRAFNTKVYEEYSSVENLFLACDNEYGQMLISPDYGLLEIVDEHFQPVSAGQLGEVLATGFTRTSQPMIRYRIGDVASISDEKPKCGRNMPVLQEVIGRVEDTVYGLDGRRMVRFHGIFVDQPHVQEGQIIQERLDLICVKIVPKIGFSSQDEQDIISRVQQRLTHGTNVVVEQVEKIERTNAGKFRAVISKLTDEDLTKVL